MDVRLLVVAPECPMRDKAALELKEGRLGGFPIDNLLEYRVVAPAELEGLPVDFKEIGTVVVYFHPDGEEALVELTKEIHRWLGDVDVVVILPAVYAVIPDEQIFSLWKCPVSGILTPLTGVSMMIERIMKSLSEGPV